MEDIQTENSNSRSNFSKFSDSDSDDYVFTKKEIISSKLPYTLEEDKKILQYVLKNGNIFKTTSISLWKKLEYKMDHPRRTYQSLKNRFLRNIKPKIFTHFKDLIVDEEMEGKILDKFPELKSSFKKSLVLKKCASLKTCFEEENIMTNANMIKNLVYKNPKHVRNVSIFGTEAHVRKPVIKKDSIKVTVDVIGPSPKIQTSNFVGIYEKYLNLKAMDTLVPCSHCGGTGTVKNDVENESSEDEGRLVIDCSYESTPKKNNSQIDKISQTPYSQKSNSPSLLSCSYRSKSKSSDIGDKSNLSSASEEKSNKSSQNLISDKELEKLYEETVANRQIFMDSEEKEAKIKIDLKMLKSKSMQPVVSLEKINVESFFFDSD